MSKKITTKNKNTKNTPTPKKRAATKTKKVATRKSPAKKVEKEVTPKPSTAKKQANRRTPNRTRRPAAKKVDKTIKPVRPEVKENVVVEPVRKKQVNRRRPAPKVIEKKPVIVPQPKLVAQQPKPSNNKNTNSSNTNNGKTVQKVVQKPATAGSSITINQNVAILIDGNNIEKSIHSLVHRTSAMLDFDNMIPKLLRNRGLNRLIYFREGRHISSKLADRLHKNYFGTVVPCHKSADIPLSITATQLAEKVDTIIILSGDSDYVDLVRHLRSRGVRVEIAAIRQTTAKILIDEADFFTEITRDDCYIL